MRADSRRNALLLGGLGELAHVRVKVACPVRCHAVVLAAPRLVPLDSNPYAGLRRKLSYVPHRSILALVHQTAARRLSHVEAI